MRLYADINRLSDSVTATSDLLIGYDDSPEIGATTVMNGKFLIDLPVNVAVTPGANVFGSTSLAASAYDKWRKQSGYSHVRYNLLATSADMARLSPTATFVVPDSSPPLTFVTRAQVGRSGAGSDNGLAPGSVALLPANSTTLVDRPGMLVTATETVGSPVSRMRATWVVSMAALSDDVCSSLDNINTPALKTLTATDPDTGNLDVYASVDGGSGYVQINNLWDVTFESPGTDVRFAFVNNGPTKLYLHSYAYLY